MIKDPFCLFILENRVSTYYVKRPSHGQRGLKCEVNKDIEVRPCCKTSFMCRKSEGEYDIIHTFQDYAKSFL